MRLEQLRSWTGHIREALTHRVDRWVENVRSELDLPVLLRLWNGQEHPLGRFEEPSITLTVREPVALSLLLAPSLNNLAEAYVQEQIDLDGALADIIEVGYRFAAWSAVDRGVLARAARYFQPTHHTRERDREAIRYHYDVSNEFYRLWLDESMVYSCAYFECGDEDLTTAQRKKIDLILTKLQVQPGQTLLDIGCGWGALVLRAAQKYGARCVGITISQNQFDLATERVQRAGLQERVEIRLQDYRDIEGRFDRITSVGMFEHVGLEHLPAYFSRICAMLADDGVAMNHGITSSDPDSHEVALGGGEFIDRHVFPRGELPHIGLALRTMQEGGLEALDVESLRRHYVRTLRCWAGAFEDRSEAVRAVVGEKKFRIWRIYLAGCAHAFDHGQLGVYQIVCRKAGRPSAALPWSRRHVYDAQLGN